MTYEERLKNRLFNDLTNTLGKATQTAEELGKLALEYPDIWEGTEASSIEAQLEEVYNGLMTGDKTDDFYADQVFK